MGDSRQEFRRNFPYSSIYCFRFFRFVTFSFRMAIANSVAVRSSAASCPVMGL